MRCIYCQDKCVKGGRIILNKITRGFYYYCGNHPDVCVQFLVEANNHSSIIQVILESDKYQYSIWSGYQNATLCSFVNNSQLIYIQDLNFNPNNLNKKAEMHLLFQ